MTPTTTQLIDAAPPQKYRRPSLAAVRLGRLAGSLRQGLPGDGRPTSLREAQRDCPHATLRHKLVPDPQYPGVQLLRSWTEPGTPEPHSCFGGYIL